MAHYNFGLTERACTHCYCEWLSNIHFFSRTHENLHFMLLFGSFYPWKNGMEAVHRRMYGSGMSDRVTMYIHIRWSFRLPCSACVFRPRFAGHGYVECSMFFIIPRIVFLIKIVCVELIISNFSRNQIVCIFIYSRVLCFVSLTLVIPSSLCWLSEQ